MKKVLIALVLAGGIGYIAFASLNNRSNNKQSIEKKTEKQEKKHECKKRCMYS
jgi:type II secretory pathway component PulJ